MKKKHPNYKMQFGNIQEKEYLKSQIAHCALCTPFPRKQPLIDRSSAKHLSFPWAGGLEVCMREKWLLKEYPVGSLRISSIFCASYERKSHGWLGVRYFYSTEILLYLRISLRILNRMIYFFFLSVTKQL